MNINEIKEKLKEEGFKHIYDWVDKPNTEYPKHSHKDRVVFYVIQGSILMNFKDKNVDLKSGDRFDVPPNTEHLAKVGVEGCTYVVGEMIDGDS